MWTAKLSFPRLITRSETREYLVRNASLHLPWLILQTRLGRGMVRPFACMVSRSCSRLCFTEIRDSNRSLEAFHYTYINWIAKKVKLPSFVLFVPTFCFSSLCVLSYCTFWCISQCSEYTTAAGVRVSCHVTQYFFFFFFTMIALVIIMVVTKSFSI